MSEAVIRGQVVILMGPTGSGKGTLARYVREVFPSLYHTVSCTTREARPGEKDGQDYYFLSMDVFEAKITAGEFFEWAVYGKNKYGTLISEIVPRLERNEVVLAEIELQGVEQLLTLLPRERVTIVYIDAGGWDVLKARALGRAPMSEEELQARYERYLVEEEAKGIADVIIKNHTNDFSHAKEAMVKVIEASYQKCS